MLAPAWLWGATHRVASSKELHAAVERLQPGDVLEVQSGEIYRGQITLQNSGTAERPIVIRGVGERKPVLATSGGFKGGAVVRIWGSHWVMENFEITGERDKATARGLYAVGDDITIRDTVVHDVAGQGIQGSDSAGSLTLERVEVYHCGGGQFAHQIYVGTDNAKFPSAVFRMQGCYIHDGLGGNNVKSRASRTEIYGNWIEAATFHELDLIGADPKGQKGAPDLREDADVVGNVFRKRSGSGGYFARLGTDTTGASNGRYRFFQNTFVVDADYSGFATVFGIKAPVQSVEVFNNVFYSPVAKLRLVYGEPVATSGANNWLSRQATLVPPSWTGLLRGEDPGFRDVAAFDFAPRTSSPLVGAGVKATTSPAGFDFPKPLATPTLQPPIRQQKAKPRGDANAPTIGALEAAPGLP